MMHGTFSAQITADSSSLLLIVRRESLGLADLTGTSANTSQRPLCRQGEATKRYRKYLDALSCSWIVTCISAMLPFFARGRFEAYYLFSN